MVRSRKDVVRDSMLGEVSAPTLDSIALAAEKGNRQVGCSQAYELGIKYKKDPTWLADLYKEYKDWDDISSSLNRYVQIKEHASFFSQGGLRQFLCFTGSWICVQSSVSPPW